MSRLYRTVRFVLRAAVGVYFFDIRATGSEKIPDDGPLIFAANHPNSIMDTVLLGAQTERQIRYMARSGLFDNPIVSAVFNHFGVIPIYRAQDPGDTGQNVTSFQRAYEALEEGGCIGIFPEGKNSPERMVRKLKTGTARIALATEDRNDFSLGVRIQPVGLNFEDRDRFLSSVLIRFGDPIDVREYAADYGGAPRETARELTNRIENKMRRLATHIEDERNHQLVGDIHDIYGSKLSVEFLDDLNLELDLYRRTDRQERLADDGTRTPRPQLEDRFEREQRIADAVAYYQRTDPGLVARIRMDIRRYRDHLSQLQLRHGLLEDGLSANGHRREALAMTAYAVLLGPVAIYGLINNVVPAAIVGQVTRRQPDEAKVAFAGFFTGLIAFPLFYAMQCWALWTMADQSLVVVLAYLISLPVTGLFFLRWWRQILTYRERILFRTFFRSEKSLIDALERERQSLVDRLEDLKKHYIETRRTEAKRSLQEAQ